MKKLGNLSLLALLAMGFALVFGGCRRDITAFGSPVTGVTIIDPDPNSDITVGGTKQLFANVLPDNAINKDVTWRSNDTNVAAVDQNGKVTGRSVGRATITVETDDGGFTNSCVVTVKDNQGDSNPPGGGGDTDDPDDDVNVITIFDPATYNGDVGEVIEKGGVKYLKITPDGWGTYFWIPEFDITGKTDIKCIVFGEEENANAQVLVQLFDENWSQSNKITFTLHSITATPTKVTGEEVGELKKVVAIQPAVQSTADWSALDNVTIYIGKITAVDNGGTTEPGGGDTENPSEPDEENEDTGIFIGDTRYKFADLPITERYEDSSRIVINSDGTLTVRAGDWDQFYMLLPEAINISGKKIAVTAKVASGYFPGLFKLIFAENDDKQSEIAGYGENAGWCDPLTTEFETYIGSNPLIAYGAVEAADLTNITKIIIDPQAGEGEITIQSIAFVEGDGNEGNPGDETPEPEPDGVVEIYGEKYYRVTPKGYNTTIDDFFDGDGIDLSGKTKFKAVMFGEKANAAVNFTIKLADKDNADISSIPMYQISAEPTEKEAGVAVEQGWNTVSETFLCTRIQPMVQDGVEPWGVRDDTTVYIGKITAEDDEGNFIVVFDPAEYKGAE